MAINIIDVAVPAIEFVEKAIRTGRKLYSLCVHLVGPMVKCQDWQGEETAI